MAIPGLFRLLERCSKRFLLFLFYSKDVDTPPDSTKGDMGSSNFRHHTDRNAFPLFENVENGKLFQKVIPDYLHANGFVADAKYIPLHRFEHLDAERATSKGFLFHPCHANEVQDDERIGNNVIRADYMIANDKNCCLHKLGMVIPSANVFSDFVHDIAKAEGNYVDMISKILNK